MRKIDDGLWCNVLCWDARLFLSRWNNNFLRTPLPKLSLVIQLKSYSNVVISPFWEKILVGEKNGVETPNSRKVIRCFSVTKKILKILVETRVFGYCVEDNISYLLDTWYLYISLNWGKSISYMLPECL